MSNLLSALIKADRIHSPDVWFTYLLDDVLAGFYRKLKTPWSTQEHDVLFELSALYAAEVKNNPFRDVLGDVYQELSSHYKAKGLGQYFTPWPVAQMMSMFAQPDMSKFEEGPISLHEPTCGSGVMVLAFLDRLHQHDPTALERVELCLIDADIVCCKMVTVQILANMLINNLSIKSFEVLHGNALTLEVASFCKFEGRALPSDINKQTQAA